MNIIEPDALVFGIDDVTAAAYLNDYGFVRRYDGQDAAVTSVPDSVVRK